MHAFPLRLRLCALVGFMEFSTAVEAADYRYQVLSVSGSGPCTLDQYAVERWFAGEKIYFDTTWVANYQSELDVSFSLDAAKFQSATFTIDWASYSYAWNLGPPYLIQSWSAFDYATGALVPLGSDRESIVTLPQGRWSCTPSVLTIEGLSPDFVSPKSTYDIAYHLLAADTNPEGSTDGNPHVAYLPVDLSWVGEPPPLPEPTPEPQSVGDGASSAALLILGILSLCRWSPGHA